MSKMLPGGIQFELDPPCITRELPSRSIQPLLRNLFTTLETTIFNNNNPSIDHERNVEIWNVPLNPLLTTEKIGKAIQSPSRMDMLVTDDTLLGPSLSMVLKPLRSVHASVLLQEHMRGVKGSGFHVFRTMPSLERLPDGIGHIEESPITFIPRDEVVEFLERQAIGLDHILSSKDINTKTMLLSYFKNLARGASWTHTASANLLTHEAADKSTGRLFDPFMILHGTRHTAWLPDNYNISRTTLCITGVEPSPVAGDRPGTGQKERILLSKSFIPKGAISISHQIEAPEGITGDNDIAAFVRMAVDKSRRQTAKDACRSIENVCDTLLPNPFPGWLLDN